MDSWSNLRCHLEGPGPVLGSCPTGIQTASAGLNSRDNERAGCTWLSCSERLRIQHSACWLPLTSCHAEAMKGKQRFKMDTLVSPLRAKVKLWLLTGG